MRTKVIELFKYEELSDEAKKAAYDEWQESTEPLWAFEGDQSEIVEDYDKILKEIKGISTDPVEHAKGIVSEEWRKVPGTWAGLDIVDRVSEDGNDVIQRLSHMVEAYDALDRANDEGNDTLSAISYDVECAIGEMVDDFFYRLSRIADKVADSTWDNINSVEYFEDEATQRDWEFLEDGTRV